ncbi:MAG TPA: 50S ribosomal protein L18e [Candidatus Pacearchaeota archaeon]|nr:50S ribosomal protein L18e [Candidatus Pacearchaeota archaeon]
MKSKTKIEKQMQKKNSRELVETIIACKKKIKWLEVAGILSGPRRKSLNLNLGEINEKSEEGDTIVVPGKVLSQGEIDKKIKIIAMKFSEKAREKLLKSKTQVSSIVEEIKKNPEAKAIRILTNTGK